jgi:hypothetical protein
MAITPRRHSGRHGPIVNNRAIGSIMQTCSIGTSGTYA